MNKKNNHNWCLIVLATIIIFIDYGALSWCKKLEKTKGPSLRYLKRDNRPTDGRNTDGQGWLQANPPDKLGSKILTLDSSDSCDNRIWPKIGMKFLFTYINPQKYKLELRSLAKSKLAQIEYFASFKYLYDNCFISRLLLDSIG